MSKKELMEKRAKLIKDAQALSSKSEYSKEDDASFNKMMDEADGIQAQIDAIDRSATAVADLEKAVSFAAGRENTQFGTDGEKAARAAAQSQAFDKFLRQGAASLTQEERQMLPRAAQEAATDAKGGFTVPEGFMSTVEVAVKSFGGVIGAGADIIETDSGNDIPLPTVNDTTTKGRLIAEGAGAAEADITFAAVTLKAYTYTSDLVLVSNELLQDTGVNLTALIAELCGIRTARITNEHFTTGNNATRPQGVVPAAAASGVAAAAAAITVDNLQDLKFAVDEAYRKNGRFMMNDTTLAAVAKLKDEDGRFLLQPAVREDLPDTIVGKPYTVNNDMASVGAEARSVLFGDFSKYKVRRVKGGILRRLDERFADDNQTAFVLFTRWDGRLVDAGTNPIKALVHAAE